VGSEPAFDRGIAMASRLFVTKQAGFVMYRQRKCVQLERVLIGIAGAQMAAFDRQLDRTAK
jgi:hypothetical protein